MEARTFEWKEKIGFPLQSLVSDGPARLFDGLEDRVARGADS